MTVYAVTDYVPRWNRHFLTPGKLYEVTSSTDTWFTFIDDRGEERVSGWSGSAHLCAHDWARIESDEAPPRIEEPDADALIRDQLLEALEYAVSKYGTEGVPCNVPNDPGGWLDRARAAIAKARGLPAGGE